MEGNECVGLPSMMFLMITYFSRRIWIIVLAQEGAEWRCLDVRSKGSPLVLDRDSNARLSDRNSKYHFANTAFTRKVYSILIKLSFCNQFLINFLRTTSFYLIPYSTSRLTWHFKTSYRLIISLLVHNWCYINYFNM